MVSFWETFWEDWASDSWQTCNKSAIRRVNCCLPTQALLDMSNVSGGDVWRYKKKKAKKYIYQTLQTLQTAEKHRNPNFPTHVYYFPLQRPMGLIREHSTWHFPFCWVSNLTFKMQNGTFAERQRAFPAHCVSAYWRFGFISYLLSFLKFYVQFAQQVRDTGSFVFESTVLFSLPLAICLMSLTFRIYSFTLCFQ